MVRIELSKGATGIFSRRRIRASGHAVQQPNRHHNQQFGSIWVNEFQSQAKSGSNQNLTHDCHLVIDGCQCSVLNAVSEHAQKNIGSIESQRREDPR